MEQAAGILADDLGLRQLLMFATYGRDHVAYARQRNAPLVAELLGRAQAAGVPLARLGATGGKVLAVANERPLPITDLVAQFETWLPAYMTGAA